MLREPTARSSRLSSRQTGLRTSALNQAPVFPGLRQVESSRCHVDSQDWRYFLTLCIYFAQPAPERCRQGLSNGGVGEKDVQAGHGAHPK